MRRSLNRLKSVLETYLVRGAHFQLLAVAAMIGLISGGLGLLAWTTAPVDETWDESIWWAFLRLTDPGYLGDDIGIARRVISTALTILGYVLFMGSLVAIMTQWLNRTLKRLEQGYTPVVRSHHFLILGWTTRTGTVVHDLLCSGGRVRRFLKRRGGRKLHIVILSEEVGPELVQELRERTAEAWNPRQITLRSGTALRAEHLERVDFSNAAAILLPAGDFSGDSPDVVDTHTIKAVLSISHHPRVNPRGGLPLVVAELLDARKIPIVREAYQGPIEILASDVLVARLLTQNVRHPGLSHVYTELLTHGDGNELFIREFPDLAGRDFADLVLMGNRAILVGVVRVNGDLFQPLLNPPPGFLLERDDRLIFVARRYEDTDAPTSHKEVTHPRGPCQPPVLVEGPRRRILVLGWSHRVPALLAEFASYRDDVVEVTVVSTMPSGARTKALRRYGISPGRCRIEHIEADYTVPAELEAISPAGYDTVIMIGSDRARSGEESDARTIVGYLLLQQQLAQVPKDQTRPEVLIEILDPENVAMLGESAAEVLISPVILSHVLTQVALRRELNSVFAELFTAGGAEIAFEPAAHYPLDSRTSTFADLESLAHQRGRIALGSCVRQAGHATRVRLNPKRSEVLGLEPHHEVVVLTTYS